MQFFLRSGRLCFKASHRACSFSACCCPLQAITRADCYCNPVAPHANWKSTHCIPCPVLRQHLQLVQKKRHLPNHGSECEEKEKLSCESLQAEVQPLWSHEEVGHIPVYPGTPQLSLLIRHTSQLFLKISSCAASKTRATSFHVLLGFILAFFFVTCKVGKCEVKKNGCMKMAFTVSYKYSGLTSL